MGVATANSVLVISFAREQLDGAGDATQAALEAGFVRLRPVLMTALAMIIGMVPMALGLGEGGEQNAPLGRAVIGGLIFATVSTLFFVPVVFSIFHRNYAASRSFQWHMIQHRLIPTHAAAVQAASTGIVVAVFALVVSGLRAGVACGAEFASARTDRGARGAERRRRQPQQCAYRFWPGASWPPGGLHPGSDLCTHTGVSQELEIRHRQQGQSR